MLKDNIKNLRKAKRLSQEELAAGLHVVRQTVSKWENGTSVPDAEMLISLAEKLDTTVSVLLGATVPGPDPEGDDLKTVSEKLEAINLQLVERSAARTRRIRRLLIAFCMILILISVALYNFQSAYLNWDYSDPETAVVGTLLHGFEFFFVRLAPLALIASVIGIVITFRKK